MKVFPSRCTKAHIQLRFIVIIVVIIEIVTFDPIYRFSVDTENRVFDNQVNYRQIVQIVQIVRLAQQVGKVNKFFFRLLRKNFPVAMRLCWLAAGVGTVVDPTFELSLERKN